MPQKGDAVEAIRVSESPLTNRHPPDFHPFQVNDDEAMESGQWTAGFPAAHLSISQAFQIRAALPSPVVFEYAAIEWYNFGWYGLTRRTQTYCFGVS